MSSTRMPTTESPQYGVPGALGRSRLAQVAVVLLVGLALGVAAPALARLPLQQAVLGLAVLAGPLVLLAATDARRLVLVGILLDIPLQLDVHFLEPGLVSLNNIGGLGVSVTTIGVVVLYVGWIAGALARRSSYRLPAFRYVLPLVVYLAAAFASLLVARNITYSFFELAILGQIFLLFVYIVAHVRTEDDVRFIVMWLMAGLLLEGVVIVALYAGGAPAQRALEAVQLLPVPPPAGGRLGGTIGSPNTAGGYLSLLLPTAAALLLTPASRWLKIVAALAFGFGGMALIITAARGGWLAATIGVSILLFLAWRRGRLPGSALLLIVVTALIVLLVFQGAISERLFGDDLGSAQGRIPMIQLAWRMIRDNPWLGIGANNFFLAIPQYATSLFFEEWLHVVHSKYLLVWAENGIVALIGFVSFLLVTLYYAWRAWRTQNRFLGALALAIGAGILGQSIHMSVEIFNTRPQVQSLWVVAGLVTAIYLMQHDHHRSRE